MILAIGEILADMIGQYEGDSLVFKTFCGGAPYNVAVNAKQAGAKVAFIGRVGNDVIGRFVVNESQKANFDRFDVQIDPERNTTLAFVSLVDGERDFTFNRRDTADYNIDFDAIDFGLYDGVSIIDLGSLMLSEKAGRDFAQKVCQKAGELNVPVSFDMNFRMDTYESFDDAKSAYTPFVKRADIIKFSEDELAMFTGITDVDAAVSAVTHPDQLLLLTLGSRGSACYLNGKRYFAPSVPVKPIDTTGAGDAFFGTFLANIDGKDWTEDNIVNALIKGNEAGARTTQFLGAVKF